MDWASASDIAGAVARGTSALDVVEAALSRIAARDPTLNAFTMVVADRARFRARTIDRARAEGKPLGPLAGVPFAVKNLFDIAGLPTLAGSKINRNHPPAERDATLIERLEAAGAVLVGALNMGEYAYDFTGENVHDGPSRNPHDLSRMSGGSSGGSGSAVAGGLVPLALGSDTNGSIRVPSSFCGIFGLKPTYGRLSRARSFPFVASFDHLGPFARTVAGPRARLRRNAGPRSGRSDIDRPGGGTHGGAARPRRGWPSRRGRRWLFPPGNIPGGARGGRPDRGGAWRHARNRDSRSRTGALGGLCHHRDRRRGAASRAAAHPRRRFRPGGARPADRGRDGAERTRGAGAEIPPLVSRRGCWICSKRSM